jgi:hypothetical protein
MRPASPTSWIQQGKAAMESSYSFNTHNICPDTGDIYNFSVTMKASDFISVEALFTEIQRLIAAPIRRPAFTRDLGAFCAERAASGQITSSWSDFHGAVTDFHVSCQHRWGSAAPA